LSAHPLSPGGRGRIGVIQPAPGIMIEHEWPRWLPPGVLFPVGRIRMTAATVDGYAAMALAAPRVAQDLASAGAGVVAYACTIGSLFAGADAETAMVTAMGAASGKPAISLAATCVEACRLLGGSRLAIITPYDAPTNRLVQTYAEQAGFVVAGFITTPVGIAQIGAIAPEQIAALAIAAMAQIADADCLWIPCTAIQTMPVIATIEAVTGKPVISGVQALLWKSLQILGIDDALAGAGRLFES
jgi:maleate isomerase